MKTKKCNCVWARSYFCICFLIGAVGVFSIAWSANKPVSVADSNESFESARGADGKFKRLPNEVSFNAHIRPIMSNTCFACHGPDEEENHSELRLDSFDAAVDEGGAIEPGDPDSSSIYQRMIDDDNPMPPAEFRHQLSGYEKALFKKWIEQGAQYQEHWSYSKLERPAVPTTAFGPERIANEIDSFILARLEFEGLTPSPRANKATLLRRLSLDLIGLPPTPEELERFLADGSSDAYEKQVDRLLASPHFGERMATQWLDIVRFSDTVGFHGDQNQRIFPYRDYVIDSLNNNKPFDEFTREQLAGDLLGNPTEEQLVATGLVRLNMMTREGGAQAKEYLAKYAADRVRMLGAAWLGSTTGCCECHNHKYDPFTIKDFYALGAFFDDVQQWGIYTDYGYTPNPDLRGFSNDSPFPPELRHKSKSLLTQLKYLESASSELIAGKVNPSVIESNEFRAWSKTVAQTIDGNEDGWLPVYVRKVSSAKGTPVKKLSDDSVLLTGKPRNGDVVTVAARIPSQIPFKTLRLEVLPDGANNGRVGRAKEGRFGMALELWGNRKGKGQTEEIKVEFALADRFKPARYTSGRPSRFLEDVWQSGPIAWQLPRDETKLPHTATYHLRHLTRLDGRSQLLFKIKSKDIGRVRLSVSPLVRYVAGLPAVSEILRSAIVAHAEGSLLTTDQKNSLLSAWYLASIRADKLPRDVQVYRDQIADTRSGMAMTLVTQQAPPKRRYQQSRVLPRGNWQDTSMPPIEPATPEFLPSLPKANERELTRLDLANWITSDENPLTARHYVNRLWKYFFGAGLSNKLDDLGNQGEWPSHPQLLDWMASEFRDTWDVKRMIRLIVMSNTYQQKAAIRSDLSEVDPYNRLLSQQSARRLEAEAVRDNALAISGLLFKDFVGGPSVFPYQPAGHYSNIQFPDRLYHASVNTFQYRRGVYVHWQRTFLHPMLMNFDAPARDECAAERTQSNSPQQALTLLNDPQFVEAANAFASRLLAETVGTDFESRLDTAFQLALARDASDLEQKSMFEFFDQQLTYYKDNKEEINELLFKNGLFKPADGQDLTELSAWSQVCRVILNLHETITRM